MTEDDDRPPNRDEGEGERPRIKVTDRRSFDRDGGRRPDPPPAAEDPPAGAESGTAPRSVDQTAAGGGDEEATGGGRAGETARGAVAEEATAGDQRDEAPSGGSEGVAPDPEAADSGTADDGSRIVTPEPRAGDLPRDFAALVEGMYLEAMLYLGAIADPRTGQKIEDVELGKYKIDLLGMLQEKTAGNLEAEEARYLEEALYQLRMVYLQKTKAASI